MKFQDLVPGRYPARITDWALTTVPQLDDALKVTIQLSIDVGGEPIDGWWDGLMKKKDGTINEKTLKTIMSAGFRSTKIEDLNSVPDALDTQKQMEVTVIKDDKGRTRIEWLNSASRGALKKTDLKLKKDLVIEAALAQALKNKANNKTKDEGSDDFNF